MLKITDIRKKKEIQKNNAILVFLDSCEGNKTEDPMS